MSAYIRLEGNKLFPFGQVRAVEVFPHPTKGPSLRVRYGETFADGLPADLVEIVPNHNPDLVVLLAVAEPDGTTSLEEWPLVAWRVVQSVLALCIGSPDFFPTVTPIIAAGLGSEGSFALLDRRTGQVTGHSGGPDGERWYASREAFLASLNPAEGAP